MYARFKTNTKTYKIDIDTLFDVSITEANTNDDGGVEYGVVVATSKGNYADDFTSLDGAYESVLEFSEQNVHVDVHLLGVAADDTTLEEDALAHVDEDEYVEDYEDPEYDDDFLTETFHDIDD